MWYCRVSGSEYEGILNGRPAGNRKAHAVIDVTLREDGVRLPVVAAQRDPLGAVLQHDRDQVGEVLACRTLPDENPHPFPALLLRLLEQRAFVIRLNPGGRVRVERAASQARRVAVYPAVSSSGDLGQQLGVAGHHAGEVHHLGDADSNVLGQQRQDFSSVHLGTGTLERRGRNATDAQIPKVKGSPATASASARTPRSTKDVRQLVRIRRDRRRPVRQHGADELVHPQLGRLQVHMRVDESWRQGSAADVHDLAGIPHSPSQRSSHRR